jgi:hypothetical protein
MRPYCIQKRKQGRELYDTSVHHQLGEPHTWFAEKSLLKKFAEKTDLRLCFERARLSSRAVSATDSIPALQFAEKADFGWRSVSTLRLSVSLLSGL